jgi:pimeloyl-ACP methyl ester carboxylesterase
MRRLHLPLVVALAFAALAACSGCASFFFLPDDAVWYRPQDLSLAYRDVFFESEDGVKLHGWFLPAREDAGPSAGTVVFLHGNAQNISAHIASVYWLPAARFNVFMFDYRGYGESEGKPTIEGVHRDAEAAIRTAASLPEVDSRCIAVFGQSLGGAIAPTAVLQVRNEVPIRALVLDSAFSDFRGFAREKLAGFWLAWPLHRPLALTVPDTIRPRDALAQLANLPIVIIHGERDVIVPVAHAERLHEAAGPGAQLWLAPNAGHIEALRDPEMRERLAAFLREAGGAECSPQLRSSHG